jgi:hypothetical protein
MVTLEGPSTNSDAFTEAQGDLALGLFNLDSAVKNPGGSDLGSGADVSATFHVTYIFTVPAISNGTALFEVNALGTFHTESTGATATAIFQAYDTEGMVYDGHEVLNYASLGSGQSFIQINEPIVNNTTKLEFSLTVDTACAGSLECSASGYFMYGTEVAGATVDGFQETFTSQAGFNPNATTTLSNVPEPSSLVLVGTGTATILTSLRRRLKAIGSE